MWSGVGKSGWPMPRLMIERPAASSALARASTSKADSVPSRAMPAAKVVVISCPLPVVAGGIMAKRLRHGKRDCANNPSAGGVLPAAS
jgi:hypothetical protein